MYAFPVILGNSVLILGWPCADQAIVAEVEAAPLEGAHAQFDVMFWGPVHVSKEVCEKLCEQNSWIFTAYYLQAMRIFRDVNPAGEGGQIFNVSSSGGYNAQPNLAYYNAAKFGERLVLCENLPVI